MNCPICNNKNASHGRILEAKCMFTEKTLIRNECHECGVIFGTEEMITSSKEDMSKAYRDLYNGYAEADTAVFSIDTFMELSPCKNKKYLDFGCGKWSNSIKILRNDGYDIIGYDAYVKSNEYVISDINILKTMKFDGIISHNVIEHVQCPVTFFALLNNLLAPDGKMSHSSECYEYKREESIFHLFFFTGKSVNVLCEKTGFILLDRKLKQIDYNEYTCKYTCCLFYKTCDSKNL